MKSVYNLETGFFVGNFPINELPENSAFADINYQLQFIVGKWNGTEWIEGATAEEIAEANKPKVPNQARSMNLRLILIQNGISMQSIYDTISSLPSPNNELAYQMFEYATHYDRNNAMINTLAQLMGVTQKQLDTFFIQAENLVV